MNANFGYANVDPEGPMDVPVCDYTAVTPQGEKSLQHLFFGRNPWWSYVLNSIPTIGDISLMRFEDTDTTRRQLEKQRDDLKRAGIEITLN